MTKLQDAREHICKLEDRIAELSVVLDEAVNIIVGMQMYALGDVGEYDEEALLFTGRHLKNSDPPEAVLADTPCSP